MDCSAEHCCISSCLSPPLTWARVPRGGREAGPQPPCLSLRVLPQHQAHRRGTRCRQACRTHRPTPATSWLFGVRFSGRFLSVISRNGLGLCCMGQVLGEIKMLCACKPCFPWCEGDPGEEERRLRSAFLLPQYPPLCRDQGQNVRRPESPTRFFVLPQYPGSPLTSAPVQMTGL